MEPISTTSIAKAYTLETLFKIKIPTCIDILYPSWCLFKPPRGWLTLKITTGLYSLILWINTGLKELVFHAKYFPSQPSYIQLGSSSIFSTSQTRYWSQLFRVQGLLSSLNKLYSNHKPGLSNTFLPSEIIFHFSQPNRKRLRSIDFRFWINLNSNETKS
jgi:hypothetical protein